MEEEWIEIVEFPPYSISNFGRVLNMKTGREVRRSYNNRGIVKITFSVEGFQTTKSLSVLVAERFVEGRSKNFDTPIHKDGDKQNCRADNLVWRPRWFAWEYTRQFNTIEAFYQRGPIFDNDGTEYDTILSAAIHNGILCNDIRSSTITQRSVFPTRQVFQVDYEIGINLQIKHAL